MLRIPCMQCLICVSLRDVLRDDVLIEISIVFVIVATLGNESPRGINGNCLKLKAESCRRITLGELPAMTVQVGAGVLELVCPPRFSPNTLYLAVES
jgi:hypothetical protein